jgi:hypothetical protein
MSKKKVSKDATKAAKRKSRSITNCSATYVAIANPASWVITVKATITPPVLQEAWIQIANANAPNPTAVIQQNIGGNWQTVTSPQNMTPQGGGVYQTSFTVAPGNVYRGQISVTWTASGQTTEQCSCNV